MRCIEQEVAAVQNIEQVLAVVLDQLAPYSYGEALLELEIVAQAEAWHDQEVVEACLGALVVVHRVFLEQDLAWFSAANQVQVRCTCMDRSRLLQSEVEQDPELADLVVVVA